MFGLGFNTAKCETQCRLGLGRFKLVRNKKHMQIKASRKEIAELLRTGKQEYARIRVEGIIRENLLLQAYEILELYLELLTVRVQLMSKTKEIPRDMIEAVSSIIYAAQRVSDMSELLQLRALLAGKYGKEYAQEAGADATASKWQVNHNLMRCLLVEPPQPEDKLAMLSDIAQEHGVEWDLAASARDMSILQAPPPIPSANFLGLAGPLQGGTSIAGPGGQGRGAPLPPPGNHGNGGGGSGGYPAPQAAPGHGAVHAGGAWYSTPQEAAIAAASLATQARAAADFAAQWGVGQQEQQQEQYAALPPQGLPLNRMEPPAAGSGPVHAQYAGEPPQQPRQQGPPSQGGVFGMPGHPGPSQGGASYAGAVLTSGGGGHSKEEVQRAYDAALGPPTKGEIVSRPSAPLSSVPTPTLPNGAGGSAAVERLPSPPMTGPVKPPPPPAMVDEYELLTRRLEALKKS